MNKVSQNDTLTLTLNIATGNRWKIFIWNL